MPAPGTREAELAKLLENTFRHVNIALVNELAIYCHELGIDVWSVIDMAATKPFGFMKFTPGPGVGGHCLPIDPSYLSWQVRRALGRTFRFVEIANDVNDNMPGYVVTRVDRAPQPPAPRRQRQPDPAGRPDLQAELRGRPSVARHDRRPAAGRSRRAAARGGPADRRRRRYPAEVRLVDCTPETLAETDLVVVLTDHDDVDWELLEQHADRVLDTRNRLTNPSVDRL